MTIRTARLRLKHAIWGFLSVFCMATQNADASRAYDAVYKGTGITEKCIKQTEARFGIHRSVMMAIYKVEGGSNGKSSKNKNGSHDLGNFQVNDEVWAALFRRKFQVTRDDIMHKPCINYQAANYILWRYMRQQKKSKSSFWWKVCRYHSGTKKYRKDYCDKLTKAWYSLVSDFPELKANILGTGVRKRKPIAEGGVVEKGKIVNMGSHSTLVIR